MENCITATDISPTAIAITTEQPLRIQPDRQARGARIACLPYGGHCPETGRPGRGVLDLLDHEQLAPGYVPLPPGTYEPGTQQLVLANPPFKQTGERASRGTTPAQAMAFLALRNAAPGGRIAMILPLTAASGPTTPGKRGYWSEFRRELMTQCGCITVVTTANYANTGNAFSQDTAISEAVLVANKLKPGETAPRTVTYVNLDAVPANTPEAHSLAERIKDAVRGLQPGDVKTLPQGPGLGGTPCAAPWCRWSPWGR